MNCRAIGGEENVEGMCWDLLAEPGDDMVTRRVLKLWLRKSRRGEEEGSCWESADKEGD